MHQSLRLADCLVVCKLIGLISGRHVQLSLVPPTIHYTFAIEIEVTIYIVHWVSIR